MNPSQSLRVSTMMRALQDSIMPAIGDDQPLAREQAGLLLGHLAALQQQDGQEKAVDNYCDTLLENLCESLLALSRNEQDAEVRALREQLESACGDGDLHAAGFYCERLLALTDVSDDFKTQSAAALYRYAKAHTQMGRAWCLPMGFDSNAGELPAVGDILKAGVKANELS